jgi:hypothetical protein
VVRRPETGVELLGESISQDRRDSKVTRLTTRLETSKE